MGWLRQLMAQAEPPVRSFGALARAALGGGSWPGDARIEPRSLAALLSKLDRGIELDWLADRAAVQTALAKALGCAPAELKPPAARAARAAQAGLRRVKLVEVPFARPLDLLEEPLCPGVPAEALKPSTWNRFWWQAPRGSGKSLCGRWLEARALATAVRAPTFGEALARAPADGALFLEIEHAGGDAVNASALARPLCVAAPFAPSDAGAWKRVASPPVAEYLHALVDWLAPRLPADGHFEPAGALEWLRRGPLADGVIDGLGTALGLCGLVDLVGVRAVHGKSLNALAQLFFHERVGQLGDAGAAWLKRAGFGVVAGVVRRALTDSDAAWDAPRGFDAWLELVPDDLAHGADLEWMRHGLEKSGASLRPADLDRAARAVPPGAFRIVHTLIAAELLRTAADADAFELAPRWFGRAALAAAQASLLDASPFEWGEALLRRHAQAGVFATLEAKLASGAGPIEEVLDLEADESPAHVAALEAMFRAAGLALLGGAELAHEHVEALWDEQMRLAVEIGDALPEPRVPPEADAPALARGCFYLSALALSEQLTPRRRARSAALCPWSLGAPPPALRRVFDEVWSAVERAPDAPWALASFVLVDRLRGSFGSVAADGGAVHALELPGVLLDEVAHGVASWDTASRFGDAPLLVSGLRGLAERRGTTWQAVARSLWNAWDEAGRPPLHGSVLAADTPHTALVWPHAPPELVAALAARRDAAWRLPYALLVPEQWIALLDDWGALDESARGSATLWRAMPPDVARVALERGALPETPGALGELWRAHDADAAAAVERAVSSQRSQLALALADGAPEAATAKVVASFGEARAWLERPTAELDALRAWLWARVRLKSPGWRAAYALLDALERGLRPARRAE
jgi:hypothetical protein